MGLGLVACGGGSGAGHVEISGKSPSEGAALAAEAVCMRDARCGSVSIACAGGGTAGGSGSDASGPTSTCVATIEPVAYADCFTQASADITALLSCPALTADQVNTLEVCFDTLAAQGCVTQAEADAQARAAEAGAAPSSGDPPASCALLSAPPPGC
jgi:hypothetical protein